MFEISGVNRSRAVRITRRSLLSGAAVNVLLFVDPSWAREARGLDWAKFLRLSEKLTARPSLPPGVAKRYFRSIFDQTGSHRQGEKAGAGGEQAALASRIVADWYSGQTIGSKGFVCVDYTGALLWEAIGFARPRGIPDAEVGRWALAPS